MGPFVIRRFPYPATLMGSTFGLVAGSIVYSGPSSRIRPLVVLLDGFALCSPLATEYPIMTNDGILRTNETKSLIDLAAESSSLFWMDLVRWISDRLLFLATACCGFGLVWYAYLAVTEAPMRRSRSLLGLVRTPGIITPASTRNTTRHDHPSDSDTSGLSDLALEVGVLCIGDIPDRRQSLRLVLGGAGVNPFGPSRRSEHSHRLSTLYSGDRICAGQ